MQRRIARWISLFLLLALVAGCQPAAPTAAPTLAPTAAPALTLTGVDGATKTLTLDEIKALPAVEGWGGIMSSTGRITPPERYKGVAVTELCKLVGGINPEGGVSVTAKDGYAMTISHDQIEQDDFIVYDPGTGDEMKTAAPLEVAIVYERAGQPLDPDRDGTLRLAILSEKNDRVIDGHWSVKWVTDIKVRQMSEEWTVSLEGALTEKMDRATFESGASPDCHQFTWTDEKAQEWTGIPLWLMVGRIDDENRHGDDAYNEALAAQGYAIDIVATDGYSITLDSKRIDRNDDIILAYLVNGNPLEEKHFPLRLVGADLEKSEMVGQIARIVVHVTAP